MLLVIVCLFDLLPVQVRFSLDLLPVQVRCGLLPVQVMIRIGWPLCQLARNLNLGMILHDNI